MTKKAIAIILFIIMVLMLSGCDLLGGNDDPVISNPVVSGSGSGSNDTSEYGEMFAGVFSGKYIIIEAYFEIGGVKDVVAIEDDNEYFEFMEDNSVEWKYDGTVDRGTYEKKDDKITAAFPENPRDSKVTLTLEENDEILVLSRNSQESGEPAVYTYIYEKTNN